jgi:D-tyrosyl-tRNA(Tyr) deacylase
MRAVLQRVLSATVSVDSATIAAIGPGLLVLVAIESVDTPADAAWLAEKTANLRIFADATGRMNLSVRETTREILVVSQFTLVASTRKGNRPAFTRAASPEQAIPQYQDYLRHLEAALGHPVPTGRFGAAMQVAILNDGPVTLILDSHLRE